LKIEYSGSKAIRCNGLFSALYHPYKTRSYSIKPNTYNKSQISSTKLQINHKSQYSMTKTFAKISARRDVKSGEPGKMLGAMEDGAFVWIFEFGSLGFVWARPSAIY
jgi:hypothetical protein